jgi:hypothetical protein
MYTQKNSSPTDGSSSTAQSTSTSHVSTSTASASTSHVATSSATNASPLQTGNGAGPMQSQSTPAPPPAENTKPKCVYPGCTKVQQATLCSFQMCNDHCSETVVRKHVVRKDLLACASGAHQTAANKRAAQPPTSISPRRTRSGATPAPTEASAPATTEAPAPALAPAATSSSHHQGARAGLAQPFAPSVDSNGVSIYETAKPSGKLLRELEAQERARSQVDARTFEDSFKVWYWSQDVRTIPMVLINHI